jgi:methionyl aminopeptidase
MDEQRARITKDGIRIYEMRISQACALRAGSRRKFWMQWPAGAAVGVTTAASTISSPKRSSVGGVTSATIGYKGYKHASCISVNHVVCHGIPGPKVLVDGDILNIDVTVIVDGWFGDTSRMYVAGTLARKAERLIEVTHEGLMRGIAAVKPGNTFGDIGFAIQSYVEANRMSWCATSAVTAWAGCSTRRRTCCTMAVPGRPGAGRGHVLHHRADGQPWPPETKVLADDWTAVTRDKSLSAQFEHSVGVTATGCEIFTLSPAGKFHPTWG